MAGLCFRLAGQFLQTRAHKVAFFPQEDGFQVFRRKLDLGKIKVDFKLSLGAVFEEIRLWAPFFFFFLWGTIHFKT